MSNDHSLSPWLVSLGNTFKINWDACKKKSRFCGFNTSHTRLWGLHICEHRKYLSYIKCSAWDLKSISRHSTLNYTHNIRERFSTKTQHGLWQRVENDILYRWKRMRERARHDKCQEECCDMRKIAVNYEINFSLLIRAPTARRSLVECVSFSLLYSSLTVFRLSNSFRADVDLVTAKLELRARHFDIFSCWRFRQCDKRETLFESGWGMGRFIRERDIG